MDIEIGEGAASLVEPSVSLGPYRLAGDRLVFAMPAVARYRCEAGRRITVERDADVSDEELCAHLIATALPALLWMRGDIVLHAAAACLPGRSGAIVIGGPSGSGKSTVLRALDDAGADMVADDSICVRADGATLRVSGLAGGYFLSDAVGEKGAGRPFHDVPVTRQRRSAEMTTFVLLGPRRSGGDADIKQVHGVEALEILLASRHRPRVPALLGHSAQVLRELARFAEHLALRRWIRVDGNPVIGPDEIARLEGYCGTRATGEGAGGNAPAM